MRGQGRVYRPKIGARTANVWWLDYSLRGQRFRESSGTTSKRAALDVLRTKIGDRKERRLVGRPERVTLADLRDGLKAHYTLKGNTSWPRAEQAFRHLIDHFGADAKAVEIDDDAVAAYQAKRLTVDHAARNSVKCETGCLIAGFSVATKRLGYRRTFKNLPDDKAAIRQGFFEPGELAMTIANLPRPIADLISFLSMVGWRRGEAVNLTWAEIDWNDDLYPGEHDEPVSGSNAAIRLDATMTKGKFARTYPFADAPELRELLLSRWRVRNGLNVFHQNGKPIGNFQRAWTRATTAAGAKGKLIHDLRRTVARESRRLGLSEGDVMKLQGWRTRAMFDRYAIRNLADDQRAVRMRFGTTEKAIVTANGKPMANTAVETVLVG